MPGSTPIIFDAHVHLWSHDSARFPSIGWRDTGGGGLPPEDGTADRLVKLMDEAGVGGALNVQVPWYGEDNRYHHDLVQRFPGRFAFLAVVDLDRPGAGARLAKMAATEGAQGVRIHFPERDRDKKVAAGEHDDVLKVALDLGLPVQFLVPRPDQLWAVQAAIKRFDGLIVVIDHLCHPDPRFAPDYAAWQPFFDLGQYARAFVKVSLQQNCSHVDFPFADLHGFQRRTLEAYGPARCLWGSNFPLIPAKYSYAQILSVVKDHFDWLGADELEMVLGGSARQLWQVA
jgi:predicted TIM-barrel fold metal-dependent hydrolase